MTQLPPNTTWLCPDSLFDGHRLRTGDNIAVADGVCVAVAPTEHIPSDHTRQKISGTITPGFIDLQVNGGGGHLVNTDPTADCMRAIAAAHFPLGTNAILPTVITDTHAVHERAVDAAIDAKGSPGIVGLHIEGPHISLPRRGTHAPEHIRPLDSNTMSLIRRLRDAGIATLLTVAPENATPAQIAEVTEMGAVISIGHSDASSADIKACFAAGARCVTHLFNAMSPMQNREPGFTGAAINSTAFAGIICDGVHVADDMVGLAFRARPIADHMFLVSDAMPTVGGPDSFELYGRFVHRDGDKLVNAEGSLAGAHTTMATGVARLVNEVGIAPETALRAAIHVPSDMMGLEVAPLVGRALGDFLQLDQNLNLVARLG